MATAGLQGTCPVASRAISELVTLLVCSDRQRDAADAASRASVAQEQLETTRALVGGWCGAVRCGARAVRVWRRAPVSCACVLRFDCGWQPSQQAASHLNSPNSLGPAMQLRQEEAAAVELRRRVLALEAETEAARVQLGHAQQMAALAGAAGVAGGAAAATGVEAEQQRRRLESDLAERQRVAEGRAQQLDALSRWGGEGTVGVWCGVPDKRPVGRQPLERHACRLVG